MGNFGGGGVSFTACVYQPHEPRWAVEPGAPTSWARYATIVLTRTPKTALGNCHVSQGLEGVHMRVRGLLLSFGRMV